MGDGVGVAVADCIRDVVADDVGDAVAVVDERTHEGDRSLLAP